MSTTEAPAVGGASTSAGPAPLAAPALHSAWNPYAILPPVTKRKSTIPSRPYQQILGIPQDVATERIANKYLQLDPPEGKMSDRRKAELATKAAEKEKRRVKRAAEGECGLIGRRKRQSLGKQAEHRISYAAVLPVHHLWLGYMAELLQLPILVPSAPTPAPSARLSSSTTSILYPAFPSRQPTTSPTPVDDLPLNVNTLHTKLTKAEFVGCRLRVKRAKNPSLMGLEGIVLQETQGRFKLVTAKSKVKVIPKDGTIFTLDLPLTSPTAADSADSSSSRSLSFDVYGDAFAFRSADRVGRKWKAGTSAGGVELS